MAAKIETKTSAPRAKILRAASELFLEGGLSSLSVRAIAKRAGLSTIGIYSHFEGKQGILDALYIEGFERVSAAMQIDEDDLSNKERLLAASNAYLDVAQKYGAHYRLIFGDADDTYQPSPEAQMVASNAFKALLKLTTKFLPANAPSQVIRARAIETWAILHGFVGLQNHAVAGQLDIGDWRALALKTVLSSLVED